MKKLFLVASLSCLLVGCQDYEPYTKADMFANQFQQYIGGAIHPEQTWGFYDAAAASRSTRGLVPEIDDPFEEFNDIESLYLEELPNNIDIQEATNETPWYLYQNANGDFEFKNGEYTVGCWNSSPDYRLNFYITGDNVTINASGLHSARFYVLPGATLTLTGSAIHNFRIFVSKEATLNYTREDIETQGWNNGRTVAAIFNRGTLYFTGDKCDIRTGAIVYNENIMYAKEIDCNSEVGQHSYLYNYGELRVTNDDESINGDFILNGAANFYNEGEVYVEGDTKFTNAGSHWINKGHYYTENMEFMGSHGNSEQDGAYNYCQLIVRNTFIYKDGTFTLLAGSYIEADYAEFRNFDVQMWGHAGINIKQGSTFASNQDADRQGFHGNATSWSYVRFGGKTTLPNNSNSFNIDGKVIFGIEHLIDKSEDEWNTAMNIGPDARKVEFSDINATPDEEECYVEWTPELPTGEPVRVIVEDLPATITSVTLQESDFDYNDAVFDVVFKDKTIEITVHAAGGTLPLYVAGKEVHELFGYSTSTPLINLNKEEKPKTFIIEKGIYTNANDIPVLVKYEGEEYAIAADKGKAPAKICVGTDYEWCDEGYDIKKKYPKFVEWAKDNKYGNNQWYKNQ